MGSSRFTVPERTIVIPSHDSQDCEFRGPCASCRHPKKKGVFIASTCDEDTCPFLDSDCNPTEQGETND